MKPCTLAGSLCSFSNNCARISECIFIYYYFSLIERWSNANLGGVWMFKIGPLTGNQNVLEPRMSSNSSKNFNIKRNICELIKISWETHNMTNCTANILSVKNTVFVFTQ